MDSASYQRLKGRERVGSERRRTLRMLNVRLAIMTNDDDEVLGTVNG